MKDEKTLKEFIYTDEFYNRHAAKSYHSAITILGYLLKYLEINSVLDFGCGLGTWCKAATELGITNAYGIDLHKYHEKNMYISESNYHSLDLRKKVKLNYDIDLAISVEVAEHIENKHCQTFLNNICLHSKVVLFSAAVPFQGGRNHINEQPLSYWVNKFNQKGYLLMDYIREQIWNDQSIDIWYRNNCVLFVHEDSYSEIHDRFGVKKSLIDVIHPDMLIRILTKKGVI